MDNKQTFKGSQSQAVEMLIENLKLQIELNKAYEIEKAIGIAQENAGLANYIKSNNILEQPEFKRQKKEVDSLYKQLDLTITNARNEIAKRLQEIQKSKQTLGAYKQNV